MCPLKEMSPRVFESTEHFLNRDYVCNPCHDQLDSLVGKMDMASHHPFIDIDFSGERWLETMYENEIVVHKMNTREQGLLFQLV